MKNRPTIYDEAGDVRLLSEAEREALLRAWESAKPTISGDWNKAIVFGTPKSMKDEDND